MDLDDFIIIAFCVIDDTMKQLFSNTRFRQRGPAPTLSESETITVEVVGEYLSLNTDKAIYDYFRRHYSQFFPAMAKIHRTTFVRQAANLCRVKEMIWQRLLERIRYDPSLKLIDSYGRRVGSRTSRNHTGGSKLPESKTQRGTGPAEFEPSGAVQKGFHRTLAETKRDNQSLPLSDRDCLRSTGGPISDQARVGQGYVASGQSAAHKDSQPYYSFHVEPGSGQSSYAYIQAGTLK